MAYPDTAIILWLVGTIYALWYAVQASIPSTYGSYPYNDNQLEIGLAYLSRSAKVIICMYITGQVMDYNYHLIARRMGLASDRVKGEEVYLAEFPIEKARSRGRIWLLLASLGITTGYGCPVEEHIHVAVSLIFQSAMGFLVTWIVNCFHVLLIDGSPTMPSTAAAAVAAMQPLFDAVGRGWFFTLTGILSGVGGLGAVRVLNEKGMCWRNKRQRAREKAGVACTAPSEDARGDVGAGLNFR